jgi:hypothetical protein
LIHTYIDLAYNKSQNDTLEFTEHLTTYMTYPVTYNIYLNIIYILLLRIPVPLPGISIRTCIAIHEGLGVWMLVPTY